MQFTKKVCLKYTSGANQIKHYVVFYRSVPFVTEAAIPNRCQESLLVQHIAVDCTRYLIF